jgi:2-polyprenyl-3-methyl-5-hydroxy-6-metoxy-1,4-benzoquinol methylase
MPMKYKSNTKSLITGGDMVQIIDLGLHGFADSFFPQSERELALQSAPLICQLDQETGLVQLLNMTDSDQRYSEMEYSYTSSNSQTAKLHWADFISHVHGLKSLESGSVLEIGSNDGYLLSLAKTFTNDVLGVDASPYVSNIANRSGIETLTGPFGESQELKEQIRRKHHKFDFIFANNVLNHSNNPTNFVHEISELLADDGIFVFEVPYWYETITSLHFDQIYHEHVTYFTAKSAIALLATAKLSMRDINVVDYHGGSLRVVASKQNQAQNGATEVLLAKEEAERLTSPDRYVEYVEAITRQRDSFMEMVQMRSASEGKRIFGIGAAAKANTFLTFYGFSNENMEFILDSSPHKQGKLTPVTRIPIIGDEAVAGIANGLGIVLAWNLSEPLQKKLRTINEELEFLSI